MAIVFHGFRPGAPVRVECLRKLNLLAHAQIEELDIGSLCGGHGVCGGDRIRVIRGREALSPVTEDEREHLSPAQLQAGFRLGCQCYPAEDGLEIEVEAPGGPRFSSAEEI
jgi:ferredoxin